MYFTFGGLERLWDGGCEIDLHLYQIAGRGLRRTAPGKMCRLSARNPAALVGALERAG